jgi:iron complex outermembrane receptor protein
MCGAAVAALTIWAGGAHAQEQKQFNIAPQPLVSALYQFGEQSGHQVLFKPDLTDAKVSSPVSNTSDQSVALAQLLQGTGLTFRKTGDTYLILQQGEGGSGPQDASAERGGAEVEALVVTAQKKEEQIQDVPIAISAFTQKSLDAQKLEGGFDLLKAIPNVTFSKGNFTGYNFSIRGIGTKAVSASTDPGVAVSFNNATLIVNRLFEQEYVDVERVEVLRGPQGTLFGRNATSGVINVISAKPQMGDFFGELKLEAGNYNAQRVRGHVNVPIGQTLAVRGAFAMTKRDGYGFNEASMDSFADVAPDVDDRDLWTGRLTVGWEPHEAVRVNLLWEHFEEDDRRVRTSKQLCHHDAGPAVVGDYVIPEELSGRRGWVSQGCLPGSLYDTGSVSDPTLAAGAAHGAFGVPNGYAIPFIGALGAVNILALNIGWNPYYLMPAEDTPCALANYSPGFFVLDQCQLDPYGALGQSRDLRSIYSLVEPRYRAKSDVFDLSFDIDVTDFVTFTSQTVYAEDEVYSTQDFNRFTTEPIFNDSTAGCEDQTILDKYTGEPDFCTPGSYSGAFVNLTPGGIYADPQLGPSNSIAGQDISQAKSWQFNQEFRIASNLDGPLNFNLGANYTRFVTLNDYYVFFNLLNLVAHGGPFGVPFDGCGDPAPFIAGNKPAECPFYVDRNPLESIDGQGHNYFRSQNPYRLSSTALFGEVYWQVTDTVKLTGGLRMTWDRKTFSPVPSQTLLSDYRPTAEGFLGLAPGAGPEQCTVQVYCQTTGTAVDGYGYPADPDIVQEWTEPTGRVVLDWKPPLGFTDESLFYVSLAHGYKGGGANPPGIAWPQGLFSAGAAAATAPRTFEPEFVDALELGSKNTLLAGALTLNGAAFYYDYEGYQVSKIVDRSAVNENFDAKVWGLELEWIYSPTRNLRFNGAFGHLNTEIAEGEQSIDLMDRTQGGNQSYDGYDDWVVVKPSLTQSSNCIAPAVLVGYVMANSLAFPEEFCPGGGLISGLSFWRRKIPGLDVFTTAPNFGAGFFADLGGHDLPNAPHWTASLGAQYRLALPGGWDATLRGDFYWQSQSFARVYNTQYDKLRAWTNTNISLWVENPDWGVTAEVYVKNAFDETPITDTFLNSDDTALTTNVFTLDPRLVGVSIRKSF